MFPTNKFNFPAIETIVSTIILTPVHKPALIKTKNYQRMEPTPTYSSMIEENNLYNHFHFI